jgi:hypothetical protein
MSRLAKNLIKITQFSLLPLPMSSTLLIPRPCGDAYIHTGRSSAAVAAAFTAWTAGWTEFGRKRDIVMTT